MYKGLRQWRHPLLSPCPSDPSTLWSNNLNDLLLILFPVCLLPPLLTPPLFQSIHAVPYPRLFPPQRRWLNTPPPQSQTMRTHTHPEGERNRSTAREPPHLPSRLPTSACFSILPLGLQHGHGSVSSSGPDNLMCWTGWGQTYNKIIRMFNAAAAHLASSQGFSGSVWRWGVGAGYQGWHQGRPKVTENLNVAHLCNLSTKMLQGNKKKSHYMRSAQDKIMTCSHVLSVSITTGNMKSHYHICIIKSLKITNSV